MEFASWNNLALAILPLLIARFIPIFYPHVLKYISSDVDLADKPDGIHE